MPSGAGHDAMVLAPLFPTAMVFVPSIGGKSHTPEEDTRFEDIAVGVRLLARALFRLAWSDHR
jgi:acetylornithine deacetylase/succinyl-diaminopimelate desuccinylase-like protein